MQTIRIGVKPFNEQKILAQIIGLTLQMQGFNFDVQISAPKLEANINALRNGQIDLYVEYSGTAYNALLNLPVLENWDVETVYHTICTQFAQQNLQIVTRLGYSNDFMLVTKNHYKNIKTISELSQHAQNLIFSCPEPYIARADGLPALNQAYQLTFKQIKPLMPDPMYQALLVGEIDVMTAFLTDSRIEKYQLHVLEDNKQALPPYEALILARPLPDAVQHTLQSLQGKLTADTMRHLNYQLDFENTEPVVLAEQFLRINL